jgi:hypothetical protein
MLPEQLFTTDKTRPSYYSSWLGKKLSLLPKIWFMQVIRDFWDTRIFFRSSNKYSEFEMYAKVNRKERKTD